MSSRKEPLAVGMLYCILAPAAYTAYNLCLNAVSKVENAAWVNCVQASVATAVFGIYLIWQAARGRPALPPWKELFALLGIGFITQVGGVLLIYAMGAMGAGITFTLQMGVKLSATAILGLLVLGERVSWRHALAIALITVAVAFFSVGVQQAHEAMIGNMAGAEGDAAALPAVSHAKISVSNAEWDSATVADHGRPIPTIADHRVASVPGRHPIGVHAALARTGTVPQHSSGNHVVLGVLAAVLAGVAFAIMVVGVRKTVTRTTSPAAAVFLISVMGPAFWGPVSAIELGLAALARTPARHHGLMLLAGATNLIGFFLVTKALQTIAAIRVNALNNALTWALVVIAGIAIFQEPWNLYLQIGLVLIAVGVLLIGLPGSANPDVAIKPA